MKIAVFLITFIASVWVFFDARQRGKSITASFLWCVGTQLTSGLLLLVWLLKRPTINSVYIMRKKY